MINVRLTLSLISAIAFIFITANPVKSETATSVVIIPFILDAERQNPDIQTKVPAMILQLLEQEGAKVQLHDASGETVQDWEHNDFKKLGIEKGADYILTGSIFIAGSSISIDSRLINTFEETEQLSIFSQAPDFENLFSAVSKVSKEITSVIFKRKFITQISIVGNKRIEQDAILRNINTQAGDILKIQNVSDDLKRIFSMGYFDDVKVEKESTDKGVRLVYTVAEKATVRRIQFAKNVIFKDEELQELVNTRTGAILNVHKLNSDVNRMRLAYTAKNYHNIVINYEIIPLENAQADIRFQFDEGEKLNVEKVTFEGNKFFSDKEIKNAIETSEKGFWSFITSSGDLNEIEVKNDVTRIESLYKNNGFIDAKVSDPIIEYQDDFISVHFKISEGSQYKINSIDISGDLIQPKADFFQLIESKEQELYSRELLRKDILSMSDVYLNQGFANVKISPVVSKDEENSRMNIVYSIQKGEPVYFDRIRIRGNNKTRDKVIRREIKIIEQDLYSKENISLSFKNLNRLNYFDQIEVTPVAADEENRRDLDVRVTEKETGAFSIGGGFSSVKSGFVEASIKERNLFGKGQTAEISAEISGEEVLYNLSFFEPYILDTSVSGGINVFRQELEFDHYDKNTLGMGLNLGYKLRDYTRVGLIYNIEDFEIDDVEIESTPVTPGSFLASSIKPFIRYDSRDDLFLPTEGQRHSLSIEYSGGLMGGDIEFVKYLGSTSFYFPLFWKFTLHLHAEGGFVDDQSGDAINIDYEKFYLGGMDSIRGFGNGDIDGKRGDETRQRGGEKYVQTNVEVSFPLTEKYKMAGVLFYDRGDVYRDSENIDFSDQFSSVGFGIRWDSPVGPLRVDYGWVIEGKNISETGDSKVAFAVGASF